MIHRFMSIMFGMMLVAAPTAIAQIVSNQNSGREATAASIATAHIAAFPGAEGWGANTPGGRGGRVIWVTNLNDRGSGSLREALEAEGPRTILFGVSGVIHLKSNLSLGDRRDAGRAERRSFVTVAGQSAPGGGITVADRALVLGGVHDVVIRHLRFRNSDGDGINFANRTRQVVLDHCSVTWSTDENIGFKGDHQEVTVQHCLNAECLHEGGGHWEGPHSKGFLISRGANHVAVHHNFISGNVDRNPQFVGNNDPDRGEFGEAFPIFEARNNLIYNCGAQTKLKFGAQVNVVANHYVYGPRDSSSRPIGFAGEEEGSRGYLEGNLSSKHPVAASQWDLVSVATRNRGKPGPEFAGRFLTNKPFPAPPITTFPADQVAARVLPTAGALPHDEADRRLIREFFNGTGECGAPNRTHDSPIPAPAPGTPQPDADRDGLPDAWETVHVLDVNDPRDGNLDRDRDGYTNLEEYLNETAARLERQAREWFAGL